MEVLEEWQIAAIAILTVVVALLLGVLMVGVCLCLRKRELLCFKVRKRRRDYSDNDYSYINESHDNLRHRKRFMHQKDTRKHTAPIQDPFSKRFSEIPMDYDEDLNWDNPLFDRTKDAAITIQSWWRMARIRIPYLQMRDAAILCQAVYRGYLVRKTIPQLKRERQEKERLNRKTKNKRGTLASLNFYDVKGYGFAEVEQLYGIETMRKATEQLKQLYGGKGKLRLKLIITVKGLKLFEYSTMRHFATVKMGTVSFCSLDPKNKKIFAFINRKKKRNFCHVFQCHEGDAQKMVETMAEAFELTFQLLELKKQRDESKLIEKLKKDQLRKSNMELDKEVEKMMKFAESVSVGTPSPTMRRLEVKAEVHSGSGDGRRARSSSNPITTTNQGGSPKFSPRGYRSPGSQASNVTTSTGSSLVVSYHAQPHESQQYAQPSQPQRHSGVPNRHTQHKEPDPQKHSDKQQRASSYL